MRAFVKRQGWGEAELARHLDLSTARVSFRSWRDTGLTWMALAGVDLARIVRRAGHTDPRTTMRYIALAEDLEGAYGRPFPPLPAELLREERVGPAPNPGVARDTTRGWSLSRPTPHACTVQAS